MVHNHVLRWNSYINDFAICFIRDQGYRTLTNKSTTLACDSKITIVAENRLVHMLGDEDGVFDKITL